MHLQKKKPVQHLDRQKRRYFFETSQKYAHFDIKKQEKNTLIKTKNCEDVAHDYVSA